jgi:phage baseplate assembly protein W
MADISRIDRITRTEKTGEPYYSDFYNNFNAHPQNKRLVKYVNEESVKRSIRNLIQTDKGERFFQPEVGCNIRSLLFEPMVETTSIRMKDMIEDTISKFEKRARVLSVEIYPFEARQAYDVFIVFEVINNVNPVTLNLTLYRAR